MIQRVWEQARKSKQAKSVVIATDDNRIHDVVEGFGGNVCMTSTEHRTGTDRIAEVARMIDADNYINVQGDEPFVRPEDIDTAIDLLNRNQDADISTLCHPISQYAALNENNVKVVFGHNGRAHYFSRSQIPFNRGDQQKSTYYKHIGLYGYRKEVLDQYATLQHSSLEESEQLEQLRFLQAGYSIYVAVTEENGPAIDSPDDLRKAEEHLQGRRTETPKLNKIRLLITDADGVLSPATMIYGKKGEELKQFHVQDGLGLKRLMESGIKIAVVSGRGSEVLAYRLNELGINEYRFQVNNKAEACKEIMEEGGFSSSETLYIGDDLNDLPAFKVCGTTCTVADARDEVKSRADIILHHKGGEGALRELSDKILASKRSD